MISHIMSEYLGRLIEELADTERHLGWCIGSNDHDGTLDKTVVKRDAIRAKIATILQTA